MPDDAAEQAAAAEKIQAIKRGKKGREAAGVKKSKIWHALKQDDVAALVEATAAAPASEFALKNDDGLTALGFAMSGGLYECAKVLVGYDDALALPDANELKVWQRLMLAKKGPASEEEEAEDTSSQEWWDKVAAEIYGDADPKEAQYAVRKVVQIGVYRGGRAVNTEPGVELKFDGELGERDGAGISLAPGGDVYYGSYSNGKRHGLGCLRALSGTVYVGEWCEGKRQGVGLMYYTDGSKYMGDWKSGKRHGRGTYTYPCGDVYTGSWFAGEKAGTGRYRHAGSGATYEGTWKNGAMAASKMTSADGGAFYGAYDKKGRPVGPGAFTFSSGAMVKGSYTVPPPVEEEEEPVPPLPATWVGGSVMDADHLSDTLLRKELCSVKPTLNVVIAGAPASGKGTQCEYIKEKFGLVHISTGDMLRAAKEDPDNEDGQKIKEIMEEGGLVPDELMLNLVSARLSQPDCKESGWLLDGFPRTQAQADGMAKLLLVPTKAILLDVPESVLVERVTGRRTDPETGTIYHLKFNPPPEGEEGEAIMARLTQRDDDTEEALKKRLENFAANKSAVAEAFASVAKTVNGNRDKEAVWGEISKFLSK